MLQTGKIVKEFTSKSGKKIILRYPRWEDLDSLLTNINELVREDTYIVANVEKTKDEEIKFLCEVLTNMEKGDEIFLIAEHDSKVIGSTAVTRKSHEGRSLHVGEIGIAVLKEYRGDRIGSEMLSTLVELAKSELHLSLVTLTVFGVNDIAKSLYTNLGFEKVGTIPGELLYKEQYIDHDIMYKKL
jgi:RimJ/RimL family protein N-acetyltransferase